MNVAPATAVQVPPELAERARREARADAEAKMKAAMESIMYAQQILQDCGDDDIADLQLAMELLSSLQISICPEANVGHHLCEIYSFRHASFPGL